jgi:hypothetical protein
MKLTVEQVAKLTKLSVPTVRVYASRQKLGTKEGTKRYFSQDDVKKLLKGSSSPSATKKPAKKAKAAPARKAKPAAAKKAPKKPAKPPQKSSQSTPVARRPEPAKPQVKRASFWSRLFGGKPKQKITLMEAKGIRR